MKRIPLTQGQFAIVDDEDFERLSVYKWYACWDKNCKVYRAVRSPSVMEGVKIKNILMHREVVGADDSMMVDHKNHNPLDNRRENLRICTNSQNMANRRLNTNSTSGFKGVHWCVRDKKWIARVSADGKRKAFGYYDTPVEAAYAYDRAALSLHGEFALTNEKLGLLP